VNDDGKAFPFGSVTVPETVAVVGGYGTAKFWVKIVLYPLGVSTTAADTPGAGLLGASEKPTTL
jgi:hypothetical protein